jgi:hypothetical protein
MSSPFEYERTGGEMKAESVSRGLVPNDLPFERQESVGNREVDFSSLLDAESQRAAEFSAFQESSLSPICSSVYADSCQLVGMDSRKASTVYHKNATLYNRDQVAGGLATKEGMPLANLQRGQPSSFEVQDLPPDQSSKESPSQPTLTGGISNLLSGIKDFFVHLFSWQGPSSTEAATMAQGEVTENGSNESVNRFFRWLGTMLSFGLWRGEESRESRVASKDALGQTSNRQNDSVEHTGLAGSSPRQNLPVGLGESADVQLEGLSRSINSKVRAKIREAIRQAAQKYDLSADLIAAVIRVESNFDPGAVSKEGAGGLMQLMPSTARVLEVKDRFDIQQNVDGGSRHLKGLLDRFGGQLELALAAYNVGQDAVERYKGVPPYRQTRNYVKKVLAQC